MKNKNQPYAVERWAMAQKLGPQKQTHKLLLLTIAVDANADGYCFPSQRTLAEQCDLCRQTVNGHLKWLEEHGYLVSRPRVDWSGRTTSKEYMLLFSKGLTWPDGAPVVSAITTPGRQPVSDSDDGDCRRAATGPVACASHREETTEEPEEKSDEETIARKRTKAIDDQDHLFGLCEYIAGLGQRGVLKPEWAEQDFEKPDWQAAWSSYVHANGADQVTADLDLLFTVIDDYSKPDIASRFSKTARNWSTSLSGRGSVPNFINHLDELRSTPERFGSTVTVGAR